MKFTETGLLIIILLFSSPVTGQQLTEIQPPETRQRIHGFVRGGFYGSIDESDDKAYIPSAFSDVGLKLETGETGIFRAYSDLRFRYGTEFGKSVSKAEIREAFVSAGGRKWDLSAGQKIIKWGRADFTNPTSKISSQNLISRSPDKEDMDLGNLLAEIRWSPYNVISLEAVFMPYYRPSILMIDPLPLPYYVTINAPGQLQTGKDMSGYGIKADVHLTGIDFSLSWFDGYDPLPGTQLTSFSLDLSEPLPVPYMEMTLRPYKIRNAGLDFEAAAGSFGIRGEAAWSTPYESYREYEYVACGEVEWAAGIDWMPGEWRITTEYSGKVITDFEESPFDPVIGSEPDLARLAVLMSTPDFDLTEYIRQQVGAFNRLYNYQLERTYHSAAVRIETDLFYGRLTPSVTSMFNITTRDFMLMPEVIWKPADGLTISLGGELYSGRKGSVYELVDEFMNCLRIALRVDF